MNDMIALLEAPVGAQSAGALYPRQPRGRGRKLGQRGKSAAPAGLDSRSSAWNAGVANLVEWYLRERDWASQVILP